MGGTMRLGSRRTYFQVAYCKSAKVYGNRSFVDERHRHRYEIVEIPTHPYYIGVQFHPEFKSRPGKPSALFLGLIAAASGELDAVLQGSANQGIVPMGMRYGPLKEKLYQNGTAAKPVNILSENVYSYCNGVHI